VDANVVGIREVVGVTIPVVVDPVMPGVVGGVVGIDPVDRNTHDDLVQS